MFSVVERTLATAISKVVAPKPRMIELPKRSVQQVPEEYAALAAKVGLTLPQPKIVLQTPFELFLIEQSIPVYDYALVCYYMDLKALTEKKHNNGWVWAPLRAQDQDLLARDLVEFGLSPTEERRASGWFHQYHVEVYSHLIPLHALEKVDKVSQYKSIPYERTPQMLVSDYTTHIERQPDPFLAVRHGTQMYVIDFWDEPGFGVFSTLSGLNLQK